MCPLCLALRPCLSLQREENLPFICTICRSVNIIIEIDWTFYEYLSVKSSVRFWFYKWLIQQLICYSQSLFYIILKCKVWKDSFDFSNKYQQNIIELHSRREQTRKTGKNHTSQVYIIIWYVLQNAHFPLSHGIF